MKPSTKWSLFVFAALLPLFIAEPAFAWGPGAHLHFGIAVLHQLGRLGEAVHLLLTNQAIPYLYGCVSADIVLAKKLGRAANHCHNWRNGIRLMEEAATPRIRSFALGYLSHLAADTVSHNCYVPSKTVESFSSGMTRHMYWELMFDKKIANPKTMNLFREIVKGDFTDCDEHFESLIPTRLFDFSTNKKVFNHLLLVQSLNRWQKLWSNISRKSPWPLQDREVRDFSNRSVEAMVGFLKHGHLAPVAQLDATGTTRLKAANKLRRHYRRKRLQKKTPPAALIKKAVKAFAAEPQKIIHVNDHKAS